MKTDRRKTCHAVLETSMNLLMDRRGHAFHEYHLLIFVMVVSSVVGLGQYKEYGLQGVVIGGFFTAMAIGGLAAAAIGLWTLHEKLQGAYSLYDIVGTGVRWLVWFVFFTFFGAFICTPVSFRFGLVGMAQDMVLGLAAPLIGLAGVILRQVLKDDFWPEFARLCVFLALSFAGAVLGMLGAIFLSADPSTLLHFVDAGALIPLVAYIVILFRKGRVIRRKGMSKEDLPPEPDHQAQQEPGINGDRQR